MTSLLFVHGINVRHEDFAKTVDVLTSQCANHLPLAKIHACAWGDEFGASLRLGGRTIPTYDSTKDGLSAVPEIESAALWATLYDDPLFELRLLPGGVGPAGTAFIAPPSAVAMADDWLAAYRALEDDPPILAQLEGMGLDAYWAGALNWLRVADELRHSLVRFSHTSAQLPGVVARALVAQLIRSATADGYPCPQGRERDQLVTALEDALGGGAKGILSWIGKPFVGLSKALANRYMRRNRGSLTDLACPVIGDVIVYQGRGKPIRDHIAASLRALPEPAIVLAHSLGGVAVVDTLLLDPGLRPHVRHLVTVGSQAGFFYEINGLVGLPYGVDAGLPADFPPWLNVYDKADMLSYLAAPAFGAGRVMDVEVASGQPFPQSHSAYWTGPALWQHLRKLVDA
jgi:hypothetical protein